MRNEARGNTDAAAEAYLKEELNFKNELVEVRSVKT